jgi:hypothetical protein
MMKLVGYVSLLIAVIAIVIGFTAMYQHNSFQTAFGIGAPWFMNQDERDLLQPFVTKSLRELNQQVSNAQLTVCDDAGCMQEKLAKFQMSRGSLNDAVDAANRFDFDVSIPALAPVPTSAPNPTQ